MLLSLGVPEVGATATKGVSHDIEQEGIRPVSGPHEDGRGDDHEGSVTEHAGDLAGQRPQARKALGPRTACAVRRRGPFLGGRADRAGPVPAHDQRRDIGAAPVLRRRHGRAGEDGGPALPPNSGQSSPFYPGGRLGHLLAGAYDGADGVDWAERGYGRSGHTDGRIRGRVTDMGGAWLDSMGGELPVIFPVEAAGTAAYRLPSNPGVTMEHIPGPRFEATADRCRGAPVVLAIQDTTTLNHPSLQATEGLAEPGGGGKGSVGVLAHAGLAVTARGRPPGPFAMDADFRDAPEEDSRRWVDGLDRARELAAACPDTRVVSVCDREGDFRRPLARAAERGDALLARASRSGRRRVLTAKGGERCLWERAAALPAPAVSELAIPASGGPRARKERVARLEIRAAEVTVMPPGEEERRAEPLPTRAVSATETDAPEGTEPLHWLPLTTERPEPGVADAVHAAEVLDRYRKRWTVETWFKTPRSGTRIKDRRPGAADDLRKCLAFDAVTACHVADLTMLARERPETPATGVCPERDVRLPLTLLAFQGHSGIFDMAAAGAPPDIRTLLIDLGRLVGAHPTKRQPLPGVKKVWQGPREAQLGNPGARRARRKTAGVRAPIQVWAVARPPRAGESR